MGGISAVIPSGSQGTPCITAADLRCAKGEPSLRAVNDDIVGLRAASRISSTGGTGST